MRVSLPSRKSGCSVKLPIGKNNLNNEQTFFAAKDGKIGFVGRKYYGNGFVGFLWSSLGQLLRRRENNKLGVLYRFVTIIKPICDNNKTIKLKRNCLIWQRRKCFSTSTRIGLQRVSSISNNFNGIVAAARRWLHRLAMKVHINDCVYRNSVASVFYECKALKFLFLPECHPPKNVYKKVLHRTKALSKVWLQDAISKAWTFN